MSFYAVRSGRNPGIYGTWAECEKQVRGFPGAAYKKFKEEEEVGRITDFLEEIFNFAQARRFVHDTAEPPSKRMRFNDTQEPKFYYAVRKGSKTGIFLSWEECSAVIKGYSRPEYRKFSTREEAELFLGNGKSVTGIIQKEQQSSIDLTNDEKCPTPSTVLHDLTIVQSSPTLNEQFKPVISSDTIEIPSSDDVSGTNEVLVLYSDGACQNNGRPNARAGVGVYFGMNDTRNLSERLAGLQTNQRAEIMAAVRALELTMNVPRPVEIRTDSNYVVKAMTEWIRNWKLNGFGKVKNRDLFQRLQKLVEERPFPVYWVHVRGHQGIAGNEQADRLANIGAMLPEVPSNNNSK